MKQVVCWDPERVTDVINIDADFVPDPVFWAVDTATPLRVTDPYAGPAREMSTEQLVEQFLDPVRGHYQLAVLGPSGAGKSHVIHRMRQLVELRSGFEVLAIRRLETNLRAVLEKLIQRLPPEERARYLEDLQRAGTTLATPEAQKSVLLDSLAQAIEEDTPQPQPGMDPELEQVLLAALPDLLRDPHLRPTKFLADGEVVSQLVDRLFSAREGKRLDEQILFDKDSLPLSGLDLLKCSKPARDAIEIYLYDADRTIPSVLTVINRNLNRAIARALNFSGDLLGELMGRIRTRLKAEGRELVILFEEFARLQGYDLAMLSALLVQGGENLCNVRWALACTSGRFRDLPDTVRTRMDAIVDLEDAPPRPDLAAFTARYLNAVRVGKTGLDQAFGLSARELPNACEGCEWRPDCFAAFGASREGMGLYPFTAAALPDFARRAGADDGERFNPRRFQRRVLKPVLMEEAANLKTGSFPSLALLNQLGGADILSFERGRLQEKAGPRFDQYLAFYQLWNAGRLNGAADPALQAFGLPPLSGFAESGPEPIEDDISSAEAAASDDGTSSSAGPKVAARDPVAVQLGAWIDGGRLDQSLAQTLRNGLFPLIERSIDWDELGLLPTTFASATASTGNRPFRNQSIQFANQATTGGVGGAIRLELPLRRDAAGFTATALALEVLLKHQKTGDWNQAFGLEGLAALSELATACANEVSRQLKGLAGNPKTWDPVAGAVDLLLVGSALAGGLATGPITDEKMIEAIFRPMPDESPFADGKLSAVYTRLRTKRANLQSLLRAHVSASKGGRQGRPIDPRPVRDAARRLRRQKWALSRTPAPLPDLYAEIGDLYALVLRDLPPALAAERDARVAWLAEIDAAFGPETGRQDILQAARAAAAAAIAEGVHAPAPALERSCAELAQVQFDAAVRSARVVATADPPEAELPTYARGRREAVEAASRLVTAWTAFLDAAETEIAQKRTDAGVDQISEKIGRLSQVVDDLVSELEPLETEA
ncbi:protein DpdH [Phenylobacterium sp.]|uniref:protein DpdH n=1 Tax=Phenylobacterium sp. TaxID=1871053 RepID=UPI00356324F5